MVDQELLARNEYNLLEQLQPFPAHTVFGSHKADGINARPRQAQPALTDR
jgi:hypothetical protein